MIDGKIKEFQNKRNKAKVGSAQRTKKLKTSRVRNSLKRYNKARSIHEAQTTDYQIDSERNKVLTKFAPSNHIIGAPSLMRVMVNKENPYIAPVKNVELDDTFEEDKYEDSLKYAERYDEGTDLHHLHEVQNMLMPFICKVGEVDSINKFKEIYLNDYTKQKSIDSDSEFRSFDNKWTFLHEAAKHGNTDIARFLL